MAFDLDRVGGERALRALVDEVLLSGEEALQLYRTGAGDRARLKPDQSPVTEADERLERRLREYCVKHFPGVGFLGEEHGTTAAAHGMRFIVDPIDGTRAFVRGIPTWSVLVGLEAGDEPVLGIAFMAAAGDLFVGVQGHGATMNGRPVRVSEVQSLASATVTHGALQQFTSSGVAHVLPRLAEKTAAQRGLADFDGYRQLLLGRVDAMIDPGVKPWDICAAAVIVREAGGRLTDFAGRDTIHGGSSVATNSFVHDELVKLLNDP